MAPSGDLTLRRQVGMSSSYLDPGQAPGREHEHRLHPCLQRVGGNVEYARDMPDISDAEFQEAVQQASKGCPISSAQKMNVEIPIEPQRGRDRGTVFAPWASPRARAGDRLAGSQSWEIPAGR